MLPADRADPSFRADPLGAFVLAMEEGRRPPVAWVVAMQRRGDAVDADADPLRVAWARTAQPRAMLSLLANVAGRVFARNAVGELRAKGLVGAVHLTGAGYPIPTVGRGGNDGFELDVDPNTWRINGIVAREDAVVVGEACAVIRRMHPDGFSLRDALDSWGLPETEL